MNPVVSVLEARVAPERAADLQAAYAEAAKGLFEAAGAQPSVSLFDSVVHFVAPTCAA